MKKPILILIISTISQICFSQNAVEYYNKGVELYSKGDNAGAYSYFTSAITYGFSPIYDAYTYRGLTSINRLQYNEAFNDFNQSIIELNKLGYATPATTPDLIKSSYSVTLYDRGLAQFNLGRSKEAFADFGYAINYNPNNAGAYLMRGNVWYADKQYAWAISDYTESIRISPTSNPTSYHNRACANIYLGKLNEAQADMQKAREQGAEAYLQWASYGLYSLKTNNYQAAIDAFNTTLATQPNFPEIVEKRKEAMAALQKEKVTKKEIPIPITVSGLASIKWDTPSQEFSTQNEKTVTIKVCITSDTPPKQISVLLNDRPYQGRDLVIVPSKKTACGYEFQRKIDLGNLTNAKITLKVTNNGGTVEAYRTISVVVPQIADKITNNNTEKRLALVIGMGHYQKNNNNLENSTNDSRDLAKALRSLNFEVMEYKDLTQKEMGNAIDNFGIKLKDYDVGLFFYAGHGIQANGLNFLIPTDADLKTESQVQYDCVQVNRLLDAMNQAKSKVNIVILDACRDNPFERSWTRSLGRGRGLATPDAPRGTIIAFAADANQTADDIHPQKANGLYTGELLNYITKPGLTIEQVFKQTRMRVLELSNNRQLPADYNKMTGDFYFVK